MSELPSIWANSPLDNLFDFVIGGDWGKDTDFNDRDYQEVFCIRGSEFKNWTINKGKTASLRKVKSSSLEKRKLQLNDIIIEISGGGPDQPVGRTVLIDEVALSQNDNRSKVCTNFLRLARTNNLINANYLNRFLEFFYKSGEVTRYQGGSNNLRNLKFKEYVTIEIPIAPINEQIRIANKLDSLLTKVDVAKTHLDKIPSILKRFRQSVLAAATSGQLTEEWRNESGNASYDNEMLLELMHKEWVYSQERDFERKGKRPKTENWNNKYIPPELKKLQNKGWLSVNLEYLSDVRDPNPSHRMPKYVNKGRPFISSENILVSEKLNFEKGKKINDEELGRQKQRYDVMPGTFAFTRIGTIGKSVYLPLPHDYGISHAMAVVRPYESLVETKFLKQVMSCESILIQAKEGVQSVGVPDLGMGKMRSFKIPLPSKHEQKEIVRRVEELFTLAEAVEKQYQAAKLKVDKLTHSILTKAFRGKLVPQDPNDEPAEKLLERIQTLREQEIQIQPKKIHVTKKKTKKQVKKMILEDAPEDYLTSLLKQHNNKMEADQLWKLSQMSIDDFYEKLRQEDESKLLKEDDDPQNKMTEKRYLIAC